MMTIEQLDHVGEVLLSISLFVCACGVLAAGIRFSHCNQTRLGKTDYVVVFSAIPIFFMSFYIATQAIDVSSQLLLWLTRGALFSLSFLYLVHMLNGRVNSAIEKILVEVTGWFSRLKP